MKILIFLFLFTTLTISAQDLSKVDKLIKSYPYVSSIEELAKKIDFGFNTDLEKAKAAYTWLTLNIVYFKEETSLLKAPEYIFYTSKEDLEYRMKWIRKTNNNKVISETFKNRKGICLGYALIFNKICDLLSIENQLIKGYVKTLPKQIGSLAKNKNHIWNTVKINGNWVLLDVTFGVGASFMVNHKSQAELNNTYFNIDKEKLNLTHYPSEKKWLDFMEQKPLKQFCDEPIFDTTFLSSNAKLISHKEGVILVDTKKKIQLKVENLNFYTKISYSYNGNRKAKKPAIYNYNSHTEIVINNPLKNSILNIYFDSVLAIQYKVVVK
jgi:transglutaminase/protease-like cytokinesis protein 3